VLRAARALICLALVGLSGVSIRTSSDAAVRPDQQRLLTVDAKAPIVEPDAGQTTGSSATISIKGRTTTDHNVQPPARGKKSSEGGEEAPDPCFYVANSADAARAAGHDPASGTLYTAKCPVSSLLPGLPDGLRWVSRAVWAPTGQAPVVPAPDPLELAQSAAAQLTVPAPVVHLGPDQDKVAVKVPVWLWVEEQPALQASVSAGGLTVNATATMTSTDWSMGEPVDNPDRSPGSRVPPFTCAAGGSAPPAGYDRTTAPPCGYTYAWRSTAARTNGAGAWRVTTVAHWTVHWVATNGANGDIPLQATASTEVRVGEWRASLVAGGVAAQPTR